MRNPAVLRHLLAWSVAFLASLSTLVLAAQQPINPIEQMQVNACRATSSLLLYRGEGYQGIHLERMNNDLATLDQSMQSATGVSDEMRATHQALVAELRRGAAFGHNDEDMAWSYPRDLSKGLRDFLLATNKQSSNSEIEQIPVQVEYLAVQYLYRSYLGSFEVAKENTDQYLGQDERKLVPVIDGELGQLQETSTPGLAKIKVRWNYLKVAFSDLNSGVTNMESISGRPFAPTMVDRHARSLSNQLMAQN
ncbi:hypothetical protein NVV93_00875 [Pseudomonas sp. LS44]|uniref:hypothetical protein n=1 Tax=Pseudomonas sp. LS44 TaxID=1357074 RepID=UPI00215A870F|nr:hypothetical protein [Pseudomonas sp. LS44]UVE17988.1 hypothetical protein NVV93_00875 [Pseudomonas sp. LS44]